MKISLYTILIPLLTITISLPSCIDIKRDITINKDGSGTDKISLTIYPYNFIKKDVIKPNVDTTKTYQNTIDKFFRDTSYLQAAREKIQEINKKHNIEVISINETGKTDTSKTIEIYYSFKSVLSLSAVNLTDNVYNGYLSDTSKISDVEFRTNPDNFELIFRMGKNLTAFNESKDSTAMLAKLIIDNIFSKGTLYLTINTESYILYSNAEEWKGKTAYWEIPLKEIITKVNELIVRFEK